MKDELKQKVIVILIQSVIAYLHIVGIGRNSTEMIFNLSASYFSDLALPFGFYFLLKMLEPQIAAVRRWWVKAGAVFLLAATAEALQYLGVYALGRTFDPLDFVAYAAGLLLAVCFDTILARFLPFWRPVLSGRKDSEE